MMEKEKLGFGRVGQRGVVSEVDTLLFPDAR